MTVFTPEESLHAVGVFIDSIRSLGYTEAPADVAGPSDYVHAFSLEEGNTQKILKFRTAGEKIDVFHAEVLLSTGSRRLHTWNIVSPQKMDRVIRTLATNEALLF